MGHGRPPEFPGAINNPLKGFRDCKKDGYGLLERKYIKWNDIEVSADDTVERIIAHTKKITETKGKRFEDLKVKLVPRVYIDWDGSSGKQHWPADLHAFDYDSPAFQERLKRLVAKLGQAWDEDPRIYAVQMGLIGHFGEHHHPAPMAQQCRLLAEAFQKAFGYRFVLDFASYPLVVQPGGKLTVKLAPGRYRFACRVRGTPGQTVEFELADGWRTVSKEGKFALTEQWQEHSVEFEIKATFKDETTLRFRLPRDAKGTFDLANTRLKMVK